MQYKGENEILVKARKEGDFLSLSGSQLKKIELLAIVLASIANGLALAALVLLQSLSGIIIAMGGIALGVFSLILYIRSVHRKAMQYPLVPPKGKPDIYLPRTDIPRPVIADFQRIEERKRKFARIRKIIGKKERRRKKQPTLSSIPFPLCT